MRKGVPTVPGPPPKRNARRRNARPDWVTLPADGRKGRAPRWPLSGRVQRGWAELWRRPQAVMWERSHDEYLVARYLVLRNAIQDELDNSVVNATAMAELRQIEDRLGLSPMAMKRLQWEIGDVEQSKPEDDGVVIDAHDRFANL